MSSALQIEKPVDRAPVITLCGDAGMGKTTLATLFDNPVFLRTEDGLQSIPKKWRPDAFPVITTEDMLWAQLTHLCKADHGYNTVILDSATSLDRLFTEWTVAGDKNKPKSINQALGGYGAGLAFVASQHQRVRKAMRVINDRGITVIFLAHADMESISPPDSAEYTRWCLRLHKKSVAPYVDDSDLVGFLKLEAFIKGEEGERKKAISSGDRILVCYASAANISKNRYDITDDIDLPKVDYKAIESREHLIAHNPLQALIPYFSGVEEDAAEEEQAESNEEENQE